MKVAISVASYNTKDLTSDCLKSILQKKWLSEVEVWVVDNASTDGSADYIKKNFPTVHLIENSENMGFAKAHNQIFKKMRASYYLVLNSDTLMEKGVIDRMITFMEQDQKIGVASCKIVGFDDKLQPNGGDLPLGLVIFNWLFNLESFGFKDNFHRNEVSYYQAPHPVGWVSGNFMMIKRKVLDKIGGFNEKFFMYFEDAEFCFRACKSGFKVMINPDVSIKHLSGGSLDDPHLRQWAGEYQGLVIFYSLHFGFLASLLVKLLIYISTILRILAFVVVGKIRYSLTYAKVITRV